ncbi:hypothetical protein C2E23DRAFT_801775 [Lenzites betulinus]|nr:hypothetical protein C2E23DRAFT_801775 [Lenzites betulinus]
MASPPPLDPPFYLLVSHSQSLSNAAVPASSSLSHPVIEYHYADDPPNSLLPQLGEHVLVLDYDPARPASPTVKSLSANLAISAVKVADAPGAAVSDEPTRTSNNSMYVIETIARPIDIAPEDDEQHSVHEILARYKHRNATLRRILDYPHTMGTVAQDIPNSPPPAAASPQS